MSEQNSFSTTTSETPSDLIKDGSTATFMSDVIEASSKCPVIVDFWSPGCAPCAQLTPMLESAVKAANGAIKLVKVNVQENPELAAQFQVQSVPTVYAVQNGQPVDGFAGAMPESQLKKFIKKLSGGKHDFSEELAQAEQTLANGESDQATALYSQILSEDPENADALGGLIKCYIATGELDAAKEVLDSLEDELAKHSAIKSAQTALDLAEKTGDAGDLSELINAVSAAPNDHQKRFDLAMAYAASGQRQDAMEGLITILQTQMNWNEGAAKSQLLEFFEAWGPKDAATIEGRKQLASLLF